VLTPDRDAGGHKASAKLKTDALPYVSVRVDNCPGAKAKVVEV